MLTEEERREIEAELPLYEQKQAVAVEAMKIVQKHRGWVTDQALADIGEFLDMSFADLDGVATFYNIIFRQPVGRHVIRICNSVSCWIMGYESIRDHLAKKLDIDLGQTSVDGRYTLVPIECLGCCDHAPAMMIDEDLHADLTSEKIDQALGQYA